MIGGFERYYQIVRCFRDEDSRADRLPEFTQLDIEMAFVDEDDVLSTMEAVIGAVFAQAGFDVPAPPWPRMTYAEAMGRFGSDRPDTRFGLELKDLGDAVADSEFKVFSGALAVRRRGARHQRRGPRAAPLRPRHAHRAGQAVRRQGAGVGVRPGQADGPWRSPIAKFLSPAEINAINAALDGEPGDVLFIVADAAPTANQVLGALRLELARRFDLVPEGAHDIRWVVQFPMFAFKPDEQRWDAEHHPFTAPATAAGAPATVADMDDPGDAAVALLRPRARRQRDRRRLDP